MELKMYSTQLVLCFIIYFSTVSAQSEGSCVGRCGEGYFRGDSCHCDYNCMSYMECCQDYKTVCTTEGSCKGRCHEGFIRGQTCDCDPGCTNYGKCCPDFESNCLKPTQRQPSAPPSSPKPIPDATDNSPEPTKKTDDEMPEDPSLGSSPALPVHKKTTKRSPRRPQRKSYRKILYPEDVAEDPKLGSSSSLSSPKKTRKRSPRRPEKKKYRTFIYSDDDTEDSYDENAPSSLRKKSPLNKNKKSSVNSAPKKPRKKKRKIVVDYEDEPEDTKERPSSSSTSKSSLKSKDKKRPPKKSSKIPKKKKTDTLVESEEEIQESEENVASSSFSSSASSSSVKGSKTTQKLSRKNQKKNKPEDGNPDPDNPESDAREPNRSPKDKDNKPKKPKTTTREGDDDPTDPESPPEEPNQKLRSPNDEEPKIKEPNQKGSVNKDIEHLGKNPEEPPSDDKDGRPKNPKVKDDDIEDPDKPPKDPSLENSPPPSPGDIKKKPKKTKKTRVEEDTEINEDNEDNTSSSNLKNTKKRSPGKANKNPKKAVKPTGITDDPSQNPSPAKEKKKPISTVKNKKKVSYSDEDTDEPSKPGKGKNPKDITKRKKKIGSEEERQETVESEFSSSSQSSSSHSRSKSSTRRLTGKNKKKKIPEEPEEPLRPPKPKKDKDFPPTPEPTFSDGGSGDDGSGMDFLPTTMAATTLINQFTTAELQTTVVLNQTGGTVNPSSKPQTESNDVASTKATQSTPNLLSTEEQLVKNSTATSPITQSSTSYKVTPSTPNLVSTEERPANTSTTLSSHTQSLTSYKTTASIPNVVSTEEQPAKASTTMSSFTQSSTPKEKDIGLSMATNTPVPQSKNNKYTTAINDLETSVIVLSSTVSENINETSTEPAQNSGSTATIGPSADILSVNIFYLASEPTDTQHFLSTPVIEEENRELLHPLVDRPTVEQSLTKATNNLTLVTTDALAEPTPSSNLTTVDPTKQMMISTTGENVNTSNAILSTQLIDESLPIHSGVTTDINSDTSTWTRLSTSMISTEINENKVLIKIVTTEQSQDPLSLKSETPHIEDRVTIPDALETLQTLPTHSSTLAKSLNVNEKENTTQLITISPELTKEQLPTTAPYSNENNTTPLTDHAIFTTFTESTSPKDTTTYTNTNNILTAISTEQSRATNDSIHITLTEKEHSTLELHTSLMQTTEKQSTNQLLETKVVNGIDFVSMTYTMTTAAPAEFKTSSGTVTTDKVRQTSSKSETPSQSGTVKMPDSSHTAADGILLTETDTNIVISPPTATDAISKISTEAHTEDNTFMVVRETDGMDLDSFVTEETIIEHLISSTTDITSTEAAKSTDQLQASFLPKELGSRESTVNEVAEGISWTITLSPTKHSTSFPDEHKTSSSLVTEQATNTLNVNVTKDHTISPTERPTKSIYKTSQILEDSQTIITKTDNFPTQRSDAEIGEATESPKKQTATATFTEYLSSAKTLNNTTPEQFTERKSINEAETTYILNVLTESQMSSVTPRDPIKIDNSTPVAFYHYTGITPSAESRSFTIVSREKTNTSDIIPSTEVSLDEILLVNETLSTQRPVTRPNSTRSPEDHITSNLAQTIPFSGSNTMQTTLLKHTEKQSTYDSQTILKPNELNEVELTTVSKDVDIKNHATALVTDSSSSLSSTEQILHTSNDTPETKTIFNVAVTTDVNPDLTVSVSETPNVEHSETIQESSQAPKDQTLTVTLKIEHLPDSTMQHAISSDITEQQHAGHLLSTSLPYNLNSYQQLTTVATNERGIDKSPVSLISDTNSDATTTSRTQSSSVFTAGVTETIVSKNKLMGITDNQINFQTSDTGEPLEATANQRVHLLPTDPLPKDENEDLMSTEILNTNNTLTTEIPGITVTSSVTTSATINAESTSLAAQHTDQSIRTSLINVFSKQEQPIFTQRVQYNENTNTMLPTSDDVYSAAATNRNNKIVTKNTDAYDIPNLTVTEKVSEKDALYQTGGFAATENTQTTVQNPTLMTNVNIIHTTEKQNITLLPIKKPTEKELQTTPESIEYRTVPIIDETNTASKSSLSLITTKTPHIYKDYSTLVVTERDSKGTDLTTQWIQTEQLSREQSKSTFLPKDISVEQLSTITSRISTVAASSVSPTYPIVSNGEPRLISAGTNKMVASTEQVLLSAGQMSTINDGFTISSTLSNKVKRKPTTSNDKTSPVMGDASREQQSDTIVAKEPIVTTGSANASITTVLDIDSNTDQSSSVTNAEGSFTTIIDETKPLTTQLTSQSVRLSPPDMRPSSTEGNINKSTVATTESSTAFKLLDKPLPTGKKSYLSSDNPLSIAHTTIAQHLHRGKIKTEDAHVTSESSQGSSVTTKDHLLSVLLSIETDRMPTTVSKNASGSVSTTTLHRIVSSKYSPVAHTTNKIHGSGSNTQSLDKRNNTEQNVTMNVSTTSVMKSSFIKTKNISDIVTSTTYNLHAPSFNFTVSTLKTPKDQSTTDSSAIIHTTISEKTLQETTNTMSYSSQPGDSTKQTPLKDDNDNYTTSKQTSSAQYSRTTKSGQTEESPGPDSGIPTESLKMDYSTTNTNMMAFSTSATPRKMLDPFENQTVQPGKSTTEQSVKLNTETTEHPNFSSPAKSTVHQEQRSPPTKSTIYGTTTKHVFNSNTKTPTVSMHPTKIAKPTGLPTAGPIDNEEMENNIKTTKPQTVDPYHVCDLLKDEATKLKISDNDLQRITDICMEIQQQYPLVSTPASETKQPNVNDGNIPTRYPYMTTHNQPPGSRIIQIMEEINRRMNISPMPNLSDVPAQNIPRSTVWLLLLNKIKSSHDLEKNLCIGKPADGMTTLQNGSMVVFRGNYFWMLNQGGVTESPRKISEVWGIPSPIDTVFTRCNCGAKTFFFKGPLYWRFTNDIMDHGYPKEIAKGFNGLRDKVTAVLPVAGFQTRPESVYFFKRGGNVQKYTFRQEQSKKCTKKKPSIQYPIYSQRVETVKYRYPRDIVRHRIVIHRTFSNVQQPLGILHEETSVRSTLRGVPSNIISAISLSNPKKQDGFDYFVFTKDKYYNINMSSKVAVKPPPESEQKTSKDWYKCKE